MSYYNTTILDDPFPSQPMDEDEDFPEWDYRSDLGDDEDVIFNIPEEILQRDEDDDLGSNSRLPDYQTEDEESGSDSGQVDYQDQDVSFAEPDNLGSDEAYRPSGGHIPDVIIQLQLLGDYTLPPCPVEPPQHHTLSRSETLSLQHYLARSDSHGTVKAYNAHAQVLAEVTQEEILSLYKVKQLAMHL